MHQQRQEEKKIFIDKKSKEGVTISHKYLTKEFQIPPLTKKIELEKKNIKKIESDLKFPNVEKLDLSNNKIENLDFLKTLTTLKSLNLSKNRIKKIPKNFQFLVELETLDLSNMKGKGEKEILKGLENIKYLKYLKNLKNLKIDFSNEKEEEEIIEMLPLLKKLNGKKIRKNKEIIPINKIETENFIIESNFELESKELHSRKKDQPKKGIIVNQKEMKEKGNLQQGYVDYKKSGLIESISLTNKNKSKEIDTNEIFKKKEEIGW